MAAALPRPSKEVTMFSGFMDFPFWGTTWNAHRKLKKALKTHGNGTCYKLRLVSYGCDSSRGASIDELCKKLRSMLNCSPSSPHRGMLYASSMGMILAKVGICEGWLAPTSIIFIISPHLGIRKGYGILKNMYTFLGKLRNEDTPAVHTMLDKEYLRNLDAAFREWLSLNAHVRVVTIGHERDNLVKISSSVPKEHKDHEQIECIEVPSTSLLNLSHHQTFPFSDACIKLVSQCIVNNS